MTPLTAVPLALYGLASALLMVFGLNLVWASLLAWRRGPVEAGTPGGAGPNRSAEDTRSLPTVTVQVPLYNEPRVAARVIAACAALDYPRDRLQIQVLDDSDDGSSATVASAVSRARTRGIDIDHRRRLHRRGYKAGALADALADADGEFIAVFDADFVPGPRFLLDLIDAFDDPQVAFVQARWDHLNPTQSWLTRIQAPAIDGHFLVEQRAREARGYWFNFNGTAGIWRRAAIDDAGGWRADTLTEDLDLSYRAHLRGWRGVYRPEVVVPAELPADLGSFRRQQHRWARGSLECARGLLGRVWAAPVPIGVRFQATMHLLAYGVHPLLVVMVLTYPAVVLATAGGGLPSWLWVLAIGPNLMSVAPWTFLITGQRARRVPLRRAAPGLVGTIVVGSGLMVNSTRAAVDILFRPDPEFERTAKSGATSTGHDRPGPVSAGRRGRPDRARLDRIVVVEAVLGVYALAAAALAVDHRSWGVVVYATLFGVGLLTVATTTTADWLRGAAVTGAASATDSAITASPPPGAPPSSANPDPASPPARR